MNGAFAPRRIEGTVNGVRVIARSYTMAEAVAHQDRIKAGLPRAEVVAAMVAALCTDEAGAPLFVSGAEVLQADTDVASELAKLAMDANGVKSGKGAANEADPLP